ncbi:Ras family protein [Trichomonas vaginalis G3]|uniref:Ras family protein n=1 Tax=Trichomonas vaginalis (strain ATCC PRA-98 / G3) TaxID=412133 RepID=A2F905_TRIV3|nr:GTPase protein [Trichomonas vaginalis G3]EAX98632.1 Ras family protein [Trichomonas vaginalis G3]KAI5513435.1 GTPase protein [Trichomonas vaginalis G3]|eukprot:XP_001311562.1 Ras family protein [Trichomonas vaginalis G3]
MNDNNLNSADEDKLISCKVVLIGNPGVGKTSLVNYWINEKFTRRYAPTIGANHLRKLIKVDDETVDVCVWDTAGQEQFLSLAPLYTRAAACAIAVAAIDDIDSFKALPTWVNMINDSCDEIPPILLAISKTDLTTPNCPTEEYIETNYGTYFAGIFYTSSKSGENVGLLFTQASKLGLNFIRSRHNFKTNKTDLNAATYLEPKEQKCC